MVPFSQSLCSQVWRTKSHYSEWLEVRQPKSNVFVHLSFFWNIFMGFHFPVFSISATYWVNLFNTRAPELSNKLEFLLHHWVPARLTPSLQETVTQRDAIQDLSSSSMSCCSMILREEQFKMFGFMWFQGSASSYFEILQSPSLCVELEITKLKKSQDSHHVV